MNAILSSRLIRANRASQIANGLLKLRTRLLSQRRAHCISGELSQQQKRPALLARLGVGSSEVASNCRIHSSHSARVELSHIHSPTMSVCQHRAGFEHAVLYVLDAGGWFDGHVRIPFVLFVCLFWKCPADENRRGISELILALRVVNAEISRRARHPPSPRLSLVPLNKPRIFISTVTRELKSTRQRIANILTSKGVCPFVL